METNTSNKTQKITHKKKISICFVKRQPFISLFKYPQKQETIKPFISLITSKFSSHFSATKQRRNQVNLIRLSHNKADQTQRKQQTKHHRLWFWIITSELVRVTADLWAERGS